MAETSRRSFLHTGAVTRRQLVRALLAVTLVTAAVLGAPRVGIAWGEHGHRLIAEAAVARLPGGMPAFFRDAAAQLEYLNPEPDRWRTRAESVRDPALGGGTAPDHFIDIELAPPAVLAAALAAPHRYGYIDTLTKAGVDAATMGILPFRILELTQRLRNNFRLWRAAPDDQTRRFIEARIIDDAGIVGHYVADGSNPAHTSIHYNGWVGDNPQGYATDRRFHSRFESAFVRAQVRSPDVLAGVDVTARVLAGGDLRHAILDYVRQTHAHVERLYQLDKAAPFDSANTAVPNKAFAAARLSAGAQMLRDLWWTAWVTSADPVPRPTPAPGATTPSPPSPPASAD